jgi:hypothetical protein
MDRSANSDFATLNIGFSLSVAEPVNALLLYSICSSDLGIDSGQLRDQMHRHLGLSICHRPNTPLCYRLFNTTFPLGPCGLHAGSEHGF